DCDFSYAVTGKVTSELGAKCDYERYTPFATYLPTHFFPGFYWGFTHDDDGYDLLWAGYTVYSGAGVPTVGPYWNSAVYTGPHVSSDFGSATYSKGVVDWTMDYRTQYLQVASVDYCHAEGGY